MPGYLLDTNHLGMAVRPGSAVCQRLEAVRKQGVRVGTCIPVLCELEVGIRKVSRPDEYRWALKRLFRFVRLWPIDQQTAQLYGEVYHELRTQGRVLSQVDIILAALARQLKLTLLTTDRDFDGLDSLSVDDWTQPS
jgi:tRNA(fMet)-specific endonuclease VapC